MNITAGVIEKLEINGSASAIKLIKALEDVPGVLLDESRLLTDDDRDYFTFDCEGVTLIAAKDETGNYTIMLPEEL